MEYETWRKKLIESFSVEAEKIVGPVCRYEVDPSDLFLTVEVPSQETADRLRTGIGKAIEEARAANLKTTLKYPCYIKIQASDEFTPGN